MVNESMVPPLLDAILLDYQRNVPDARDAEVLSVTTTIIHKLHVRWTPGRSRHMVSSFFNSRSDANLLQALMDDKISPIMDAVFECTLDMINKDFHEYPEFRVEFFKLLQAINLFCFNALLKLDGRQFKFVIDSCMWASKHDNREVENTGLAMCLELVNNMADQTDPQISGMFFQQFYISILQDVFFVLTDSDHKAGFKTQCMLLARMFQLVETGKISQPLYTDSSATPGTSNKDYVGKFTANLLQGAFPNLKEMQISHFVNGLFQLTDDPNKFKTHIRDFLISLKEFAGDNTDLYADDREQEKSALAATERERNLKVGGLIKPSELDEDEL